MPGLDVHNSITRLWLSLVHKVLHSTTDNHNSYIPLNSFIFIRIKSKFLVGAYTSPYHLAFASDNASGAPMLSLSLLSDS